MTGQILRPRYDRKIAGVCAAFARAYGWDLTVVRLVVFALAFFGGGGLLAYVICWIVIPEDPVAFPPYPPPGYPPPGQYPPAGQYPPPGQYPPSTDYPPPPPSVPPTA